ncbi:MAG: acylphosphatase [Lachnospiraceae bacterium]|nr:acylphosphatase [Lachnospiraceae bacterium]
MEKIRLELHYYGRVQGVGFRYWAKTQAIKFHVTGWVRNEYDGSVTVQVQGTQDQIERFMYGIEHGHSFMRINEVKANPILLKEKESDFLVRY